jgi:4-azaleucine resistance transporter AzlC
MGFTLLDMSSLWRTTDRATLRDIAMVCLADAIVGASFGAIAVAGGLSLWAPIAMSVFVFAGGAQLATVAVVLSGGSPVAAVAAGLILNGRLLPYGFAVADVLDGRWWTRLLGTHVITDESVAFALRHREPAPRRAAFWTCGLLLFVCWNLSVALGAIAGRSIGNTEAIGLDAAFPAVLLALILPSLADRGARNAALLGVAVALVATPYLPAGLPVLLALVGIAPLIRSGATKPAQAEPVQEDC